MVGDFPFSFRCNVCKAGFVFGLTWNIKERTAALCAQITCVAKAVRRLQCNVAEAGA